MKENRPNVLNLDLNAIVPDKNDENFATLYPYHSTEMSILFVYGNDHKRHTTNFVLNELKPFFHWHELILLFTAIVLCFLRRTLRLRRDGFISAFIDMNVVITGGGNLRVHHRIERIFFAFMFVAYFFMTAIWLETTLYPSFLIPHQTVDTFDELAEINAPIYISDVFVDNEQIIIEMLKLVSTHLLKKIHNKLQLIY